MSDTRQEVRDFVDLLLSDPAGQIVACNILHCCDEGLFAREKIEEILQLSLRQFANDTPESCLELLGLVEIEWQAYRFHGPAITLDGDKLPNGGLYHVVRYDYFLDMIDASHLNESGIVLKNPFDTVGGLLQVEALNRLSNSVDRPFVADAKLGGKTLWLTPSKMARFGADRLRDLLGLIQHGIGVPLVRIAISMASTHKILAYRPTFATAGTHRRFRHRPDTETPSGFGRAVDLARHSRKPVGSSVDGALEVVSEPQPLAALKISWECVGRTEFHGEYRARTTQDALPSTPNYDEKFVQRLLGKRCLGDVRREMETLFQLH